MSLSIKGKLASILEAESGTSKAGKEWRKQSFVIDNGDQFNPNVCFSLFGQDKIAMLDNFSIGQEIEVAFNLSSREFNGKWYHNLDAWKISIIGSESTSSQPQAVSAPSISDAPEEGDDLPF
ncbi:MAG: hypothetical protein CVT95_06470 [Bacteroidetes bacterium HGW-Bacteroidetes-12]|nr:MAG: hypothetical protein CVT95_06470 [Bacteroidetes bacterium HGW-Bacteroidetes-12]